MYRFPLHSLQKSLWYHYCRIYLSTNWQINLHQNYCDHNISFFYDHSYFHNKEASLTKLNLQQISI